jgi:hypothetical protein
MDTREDQDDLYRIQLLQAFGLDEWDDDVINDTIYDLYNSMKLDLNFQTILEHISQVKELQEIIAMSLDYVNNNDCDKNIIYISILFQYDYFDLFHRCIYDFMSTKEITDKSMNALLKNNL